MQSPFLLASVDNSNGGSEVLLKPAVPQLWRIVPHATLHWKVWDDRCVVFNSASGQTHLLDPIPGLLLRQVNAGFSKIEEVAERMAILLDIDLTDAVRHNLEHMLQELNNLGLIEPITP